MSAFPKRGILIGPLLLASVTFCCDQRVCGDNADFASTGQAVRAELVSQASPGGPYTPEFVAVVPSTAKVGQSRQEPSSPQTQPHVTREFGQLSHALPPEVSRAEDAATGIFADYLHGQDPIAAKYAYIGEVFTNTRGGRSTRRAVDYMGVFDVALDLDLERLGCFAGGELFVYAQEIHGRGITERYVGDFQVLSNIDAPDRMQVSEYWWQRGFFDGRLTVRLGKQDANTEFAVVDAAVDFIQSSYGFHPTIPMPSYPDSSMAAVGQLQLSETVGFACGVFDGLPDGRNWGFSNSGVTFSIYELETQWELFHEQLPGALHGGLWHHSDRWEAIDGDGSFAGNYGAYVGGEQVVFRECCLSGDEQGLTFFGQYGWAPPGRNEANHYLGFGLLCRGLLQGRDQDLCGVGVSSVIFSKRRTGYGDETGCEIFYKAALTENLALQPDLQYIARPSGQYRDALVLGLRFELAL